MAFIETKSAIFGTKAELDEWPRKHEEDKVNAPDHYTSSEGIECIDYIKQVLTPAQFTGFCHGNVIKYQHRYAGKHGKQDLEKAEWYLRKMIDNLGG